jgi:DNA-binding HxlR family transcriptional regulator
MLAQCKLYDYNAEVKPSPRRSGCPINAYLEVFGDRWTMLIIRDLLFKGRTHYKDFLQGGEGVATNILASRLRLLESAGIIDSRNADKDARRRIYRLTSKGLDLAPILVEMVLWGAKYYKTAAPPAIIRKMRHDRDAFLTDLRRTHENPHLRRGEEAQ